MNQLYIAPTFTLVGGFIVWTLTQLAGWRKGQKDDDRIRKETLYHLLEVIHVVKKLDHLSSGFMQQVISSLTGVLPELKDASQSEIDQVYDQLLRPALETQLLADLERIEAVYEQTILKFSQVDPVIAYHLRGRAAVFGQARQFIQNYTTNVLSVHLDPKAIGEATRVFSDMTTSGQKESLQAITETTLEIAKKVGRRTSTEVKKLLVKDQAELDMEREEDIRQLAQAIIAAMKNYDGIPAEQLAVKEEERNTEAGYSSFCAFFFASAVALRFSRVRAFFSSCLNATKSFSTSPCFSR